MLLGKFQPSCLCNAYQYSLVHTKYYNSKVYADFAYVPDCLNYMTMRNNLNGNTTKLTLYTLTECLQTVRVLTVINRDPIMIKEINSSHCPMASKHSLINRNPTFLN